jgi:hypothetical protein
VIEIDTKIDQLYQRPLGEFIGARNALAKALPRPDAERVRRLPKPAAVAWAINQLYWRHRSIYNQLRHAGDRLRAAQFATLEGRSADVGKAADVHRRALADAAQAAGRLAEAAGTTVNRDSLAHTLEALSLATEPPETPGRLTSPLHPAGFEVLAGVRPRAAPVVVTGPQARNRESGSEEPGGLVAATRGTSNRRTMAALEQERREASAALTRAETAMNQSNQRMIEAERQEARARSEWERTKKDLDEARDEVGRATTATALARQRLHASMIR